MIFISYRRSDCEGEAWALAREFEHRYGDSQVFLDRLRIEPGEQWRQVIDQGLSCATVAVALIGPDWLGIGQGPHGRRLIDLSDDMVAYELASVLGRVQVIPVYLRGADYHHRDALPEQLVGLARDRLQGIPFELARDMHTLFERIDQFVTPRPEAQAPREIPVLSDDFTGREEQLKTLESMLEKDHCGMIAIRGLGGIGKTQLGLAFANRVGQRFPDGHFYMDLRGVGSNPAAPREVAGHILHACGLKELPEDPQELLGLLRTTLANRRCLIFLDNVRDGRQIEPLLPVPAGSLVLITSRQRFYVAGQKSLALESLTETEAVALLKHATRRDEKGLVDLARCLSFMPLALILAVRAMDVHSIPVSQYLDRLKDARRRARDLSDLDASIQLSCEMIGPAERERFADLSVFSGSFTAEMAASACGIHQTQIEDAMEELARFSLLRREGVSDRFSYHDMVRTYAATRLVDDRAMQVSRRHSAWFAAFIARLESDYLKLGNHAIEAMRALDGDWAHISTGWSWANRHAEADAEARRLLHSYAAWGEYLLVASQRDEEIRTWWRRGLWAAQIDNDVEHIGVCARRLSYNTQDQAETRRLLALAVRSARKTGDELRLGCAYFGIAAIHRDARQHRRALACDSRVIRLARQVQHPLLESFGEAGMARTYRALGQYEDAVQHYNARIAISQRIGYVRGELYERRELAALHADRGKTDEACRELELAARAAESLGYRGDQGQVISWSGHIALQSERFEDAIRHFNDYLDLAAQIGGLPDEESVRSNLIVVCTRSKDSQLAQTTLDRHHRIELASGGEAAAAAFLRRVALAYITAGRPEQANACLERLGIADGSTGDPDQVRFLIDFASAATNTEDKIRHLQHATRVATETGDLALQARAHRELSLRLYYAGKLNESRHHMDQSLACLHKSGSNNALMTESDLAYLTAEVGEYDEAEIAYRAVIEKACASDDRYIEALARNNLGLLRVEQGRIGEARLLFLKARWLLRPIRVMGRRELGEVLANLGELDLNHHSRPHRALARGNRAARLAVTSSDGELQAKAGHLVARSLARMGRFGEAVQQQESVVRYFETMLHPMHMAMQDQLDEWRLQADDSDSSP